MSISKMETLKRPLNYLYYYCQSDSVNQWFCISYWFNQCCPCKCILLSLMNCNNSSVIYLHMKCITYWMYFGYLYSDSSTSCLISALVPYHSHLLLLLTHVVIVVKPCCVEGLMKIDVHLISALVNKNRYYYY